MLPLVDEKRAHPGEHACILPALGILSYRPSPARLMPLVVADWFGHVPALEQRQLLWGASRSPRSSSRSREPPSLTSGRPRGRGSGGAPACDGAGQGLKGRTLGEKLHAERPQLGGGRDFARPASAAGSICGSVKTKIRSQPLYPLMGPLGAGAHPSCLQLRGGEGPGQAATFQMIMM